MTIANPIQIMMCSPGINFWQPGKFGIGCSFASLLRRLILFSAIPAGFKQRSDIHYPGWETKPPYRIRSVRCRHDGSASRHDLSFLKHRLSGNKGRHGFS
jgi:hypothetical protein